MLELVQWWPTVTAGSVFLEVRAGHDASVRELIANDASLSWARIDTGVYLPGINLDGGWVTVDDDAPGIVVLSPSDSEATLATCRALAPHVDHAELLLPAGYAVTLRDGACRVVAIAEPWIEHVARALPTELAYRVLIAEAAACAAGRHGHRPSEGMLAPLAVAARLCPEQFDAHALAGWLSNELGRYTEAIPHCERAIATPAAEHIKAAAHGALGYAWARLGHPAKAVEARRRAYAGSRQHMHRRELGIALMHAGEFAEADPLLRPWIGVGHGFVRVANALADLGEAHTAAALERIGLEIDPKLRERGRG